jgi:general secretion pathway protein J
MKIHNPASAILNPSHNNSTAPVRGDPSFRNKTVSSSIFRGNAPAALRSQSCQRGFTLIELLVSLVILALLSIAGYRSLDAVLQTRERVAAETRKWQHLTFFFSRLEMDIAQAVHRSVRDSGGLLQPEWIGHAVVVGEDDAELTFTRAGIADQGLAMQSPQRIAYRLEQGNIVLLRWQALDMAERMRPVRYTLLEGVSEFTWRYLDSVGNWQTQWPVAVVPAVIPASTTTTTAITPAPAATTTPAPATAATPAPAATTATTMAIGPAGLPQAAEVSLTLSNGDKITRIFALQ